MTYDKFILHTPTAFALEDNGVWMTADFTGSRQDDLVYIKIRNTDSKKVEVHVVSAASGYKDFVYHQATDFDAEDNGTWLMIPSAKGGKPDLCYIKTRNTPNNLVEVHIASGASDYQKRTLETPTTFASEHYGAWMMADFNGNTDQDLVYVKNFRTGTKSVEPHVASAASGYKKRIYESGSAFREESNGTWILRPWSKDAGQTPDLVYIKTSNTDTGKVEVHVVAGPDYKDFILHTPTAFGLENNGTWTMSASKAKHPDLIYIKTHNTDTGKVEMHVVSCD